MIKINGTIIKTPSSFKWGLDEMDTDDSGRTLDAKMHIDTIADKRKLECSWSGLNRAEASTLLQSVKRTNAGRFFSVTYPDTESGTDETRMFYVGPRSSSIYSWTDEETGKVFSDVAFNLIEQ